MGVAAQVLSRDCCCAPAKRQTSSIHAVSMMKFKDFSLLNAGEMCCEEKPKSNSFAKRQHAVEVPLLQVSKVATRHKSHLSSRTCLFVRLVWAMTSVRCS